MNLAKYNLKAKVKYICLNTKQCVGNCCFACSFVKKFSIPNLLPGFAYSFSLLVREFIDFDARRFELK